ncbi:Uncharacterised protein [Chlamydia trachomatis]|nr:Uncharacterised protein [Chlamydia trachomatis]
MRNFIFKSRVHHWVGCCHDGTFCVSGENFLGYKRYDWVEETQDFIQSVKENRTCHHFFSFIVTVEDFLGQLNVPVGKFFPDEVVKDVTCHTKLELVKVFSNLGNGFVEVVENPFIRHITGSTRRDSFDRCRRLVKAEIFIVHEDITRNVPDFVNEVP